MCAMTDNGSVQTLVKPAPTAHEIVRHKANAGLERSRIATYPQHQLRRHYCDAFRAI
jgi:hypothetical protein